MAAPSLPEGWTAHGLNGSTFYYHAASNTTRQDPPEMPAPKEQPTPCPEPASEPQPPSIQHQEWEVYPSVAAPKIAVAVPATATAPQPAMYFQAAQVPVLPPGLQLQPGVYSNPTPQVPAPVASPPTAGMAQVQPTMQLKVLVPDPGLRAGQQLAFTAPAAQPGLQPQQMAVTVNQTVVPGSIVTVQYPVPHGPEQPSLPQTTSQLDPEEDLRQSKGVWALFLTGLCCLCFFAPCAPILWVLACSSYFCKPAHQRAQLQQTRTPATFAAVTCGCVLLLLLLGAVGAGISAEFQHPLLRGKTYHGPPPYGPPKHEYQHVDKYFFDKDIPNVEDARTLPKAYMPPKTYDMARVSEENIEDALTLPKSYMPPKTYDMAMPKVSEEWEE